MDTPLLKQNRHGHLEGKSPFRSHSSKALQAQSNLSD